MSKTEDFEYKEFIKAINRGYPIKIPYHKDVIDYFKIIIAPEQALLLSVFKRPFLDMLTIKQIVKRAKEAGIEVDKKMAKELLDPLADKGLVMKLFGIYALLPFVPGLFEFYFSAHTDSIENMTKVAKQLEKLRDGPVKLLHELSSTKTPIFRVLPSSKPVEKIIKINKDVDAQTKILPFETVKEFLKMTTDYAVVDCSCRYHAQFTEGVLCEKPLRICMALGPAVSWFVDKGWGDRLTYEQALEKLVEAEDAGLVHQVMNSREVPVLICNCCSCHCGILGGIKASRNPRAIIKSNFLPKFNHDKCVLCEKCVKLCPMEALFRYYPRNENLDDDHIQLVEESCIGCGLCSYHCKNGAITLKKVKNQIPLKDFAELIEQSERDRVYNKL
ncbi:MAG: ATP-binding protein [Candidatus Hodarchaeota archaeon]